MSANMMQGATGGPTTYNPKDRTWRRPRFFFGWRNDWRHKLLGPRFSLVLVSATYAGESAFLGVMVLGIGFEFSVMKGWKPLRSAPSEGESEGT